MLSPEARTVAMDLLKPPPGRRLDRAVLTTFSLDLETMLALPLAVLAQVDGGLEEILDQPLLLLTALREAGERIQVFVDRAGIGIPRVPRALYALLEQSVHLVKAPNGGAFHPKVWFARFVADDEPPLLRIAILSRNLTDDRSWDLALASEAQPYPRRTPVGTRPLAGLLRALPRLCEIPLRPEVDSALGDLADELARTSFPAPAGFEGEIRFHCLGLKGVSTQSGLPLPEGRRVLAMAPFVNQTALAAAAAAAAEQRTLISRAESLDDLPDSALAAWGEVLVLADAAAGEDSDGQPTSPKGLHAKAICIEHGPDATWLLGSANLTRAAFFGLNVEVMAELTGKRGSATGPNGCGIERFRAGMERLWQPYCRGERGPVDAVAHAARERLEQARRALLEANLRLRCRAKEDGWCLTLDGALLLPGGIDSACWPVSIQEGQASAVLLPLDWHLPTNRLTSFIAFRLHAPELPDGDLRLTLRLPAEGLPDGRIHQILRHLIDSPERLLQFLRALLGGFEGLMDWSRGDGHGEGAGGQSAWPCDGAVLEDLMRTASRDPARLAPIRRLIDDLLKTEEGRRLVPDDLLAIWQAVEVAIAQRGTP